MGNKLKAVALAWAVLLPTVLMVVVCSSPVQGASSQTTASGWFTGTLDSKTVVTNYDGIAIDAAGNLHICYQDTTSMSVKYATNKGGHWSYTTVDHVGSSGAYFASIAVDRLGAVHISYYDQLNENLKYATNKDGSWKNYTIDSVGNVGEYTSIGIDSNNKVHISYYDYTNRALKYATNAGGSWTNTTVDYSLDGYSFTSLAVDASNKVHISYYDFDGSKIKYATNELGSWKNETAATEDTSTFNSLALSPGGQPNIAYWGKSSGELKVASKSGSVWSSFSVDNETNTEWQVSVASDSLGHLHISYYDSYNQDLRYATNDTGTWKNDSVDTYGNVGFLNSLAIDPNGKVFIAYVDSTNDRLKLATNAGAQWTLQGVDDNSPVGVWNSIALDSSGITHIAYYDSNHGVLKVATPFRAGWESEIVDGNPHSGLGVHMVIDQHNKAHLSYYNSDDHELKYATDASGTWVNTTVTGWTTASAWNSIAVDSNDKVHIVYVESGKLKYANNTVGGFSTTYIDTSGDVAEAGTSIVIDAAGVPYVTYIADNELKLAYKTGAITWNITTIDSPTNLLAYNNSLAIDSHHHVHITYYETTGVNGELKYATNASGSWVVSTIDNTADVGRQSIIKVDGQDGLHVFYLDWTSQKGRYAVNSQGVWMKTTMREADSIGACSMVLDSIGRAHVSYFDATNSTLKYATTVTSPSAPSSFSLVRGNEIVTLTWQMPANNGGYAITGYRIYRGDAPSNMSLLTQLSAGIYTYQDSGLQNGVKLWYSVAAVNGEGRGAMASARNATPATLPGTPTDLQIKVGDRQLELSWTAPSSNGGEPIEAYNVYRGEASTNLTFIGSSTGTSYRDTGLDNGKTYFYEVTASNAVGEGQASAVAQAAPRGIDLLLVVGILAVIAVLVVVAIVLLMRRKA